MKRTETSSEQSDVDESKNEPRNDRPLHMASDGNSLARKYVHSYRDENKKPGKRLRFM